MAFRPLRSRLAIRKEKDVVTEARHRLERVRLKGLSARQEKRHDGGPRLDVLDSVRGDPEAHASSAFGDGRIHFGLQLDDAGDEETVPSAPREQRPAVNLEPVRHISDGEATKADDPPLFVRVGEALEIDRKSVV